MAGSVNKCIILGNLCAAPECRNLQDGTRVANFTVACNESWKDKKTGERKERAEFVRIVIFNDKLAEVAEKYLKKGSKVYLEGQLQTRKWQDQSGNDKYTTEVVLQRFRGELVMLGEKQEGDGKYPSGHPRATFDLPPSSDDDSEIPF